MFATVRVQTPTVGRLADDDSNGANFVASLRAKRDAGHVS
jgi:hypothetical protein